MMPNFPKSHEQMIKLRDAKLWEGYYSASPILSQLRMRPQREGRTSSFQDEEGVVRQVDYKKASVTTQRKLTDFRGMSLQQYCEASSELGRGMGMEVLRNLFDSLEKVTQETGNAVDAHGGPITQELFLELLEKIHMDFMPNGEPIWPTLSLGPEAHRHFKQIWPEWLKDSEFQKRLIQILEQKRESFYEREACRRLVD